MIPRYLKWESNTRSRSPRRCHPQKWEEKEDLNSVFAFALSFEFWTNSQTVAGMCVQDLSGMQDTLFGILKLVITSVHRLRLLIMARKRGRNPSRRSSVVVKIIKIVYSSRFVFLVLDWRIYLTSFPSIQLLQSRGQISQNVECCTPLLSSAGVLHLRTLGKPFYPLRIRQALALINIGGNVTANWWWSVMSFL